jgi:hypothetical protein
MLELINGPSKASELASALSADASAAANRISAAKIYKADININLPPDAKQSVISTAVKALPVTLGATATASGAVKAQGPPVVTTAVKALPVTLGDTATASGAPVGTTGSVEAQGPVEGQGPPVGTQGSAAASGAAAGSTSSSSSAPSSLLAQSQPNHG